MIERLGSLRPRTVLVGALATVVIAIGFFAVWPAPAVEEIAGPLLDTRFMASGSDTAAYLDALGAQGRRRYAILATGDLLWAILHGLTLAAVIAVGARRSSLGSRWALVAVAALTYLVLDVAENGSILAALAAHPEPQPVPAVVMDLATSAKFVALAVGYLGAVPVLVAWARARRGRARD